MPTFKRYWKSKMYYLLENVYIEQMLIKRNIKNYKYCYIIKSILHKTGQK